MSWTQTSPYSLGPYILGVKLPLESSGLMQRARNQSDLRPVLEGQPLKMLRSDVHLNIDMRRLWLHDI